MRDVAIIIKHIIRREKIAFKILRQYNNKQVEFILKNFISMVDQKKVLFDTFLLLQYKTKNNPLFKYEHETCWKFPIDGVLYPQKCAK